MRVLGDSFAHWCFTHVFQDANLFRRKSKMILRVIQRFWYVQHVGLTITKMHQKQPKLEKPRHVTIFKIVILNFCNLNFTLWVWVWHLPLLGLTLAPIGFDTCPNWVWHMPPLDLTHAPIGFDTCPHWVWHMPALGLTHAPIGFDTYPHTYLKFFFRVVDITSWSYIDLQGYWRVMYTAKHCTVLLWTVQ